jgi:hypothetical protein
MKMHKAINWVLPSLVIVAAVVAVAMSGVRVQAASETAPITLAQAAQVKKDEPARPGAPGAVKANPKAAKVLCGGKTTAECCKGIAFCGCLANPMPKKGDEDKPLSCTSSPPPSPKG